MKNERLLEYIADISIVIISLIWGSTFIVVKKGVEVIEPATFLTVRFGLATVVMFVISIPYLKHLNRKLFKDGIILGLFLFITFLTQTLALDVISSTEVGFLTGLYVLFVPILSALIYKRVPHIFSILGVVFAAMGMLMVTFQSGFHMSAGQILGILNAFFIGVYILQVDVYSKKHNVVILTFVQIAFTAVLSAVYALIFEPVPRMEAFDSGVMFSLAYLAVFATVVCFFVQTAMQKYTTPTKAAIMFTLEPLSSAFFGYFLGGEILAVRQYLGAGLIVVAILVAEVGTALKHSKGKSY